MTAQRFVTGEEERERLFAASSALSFRDGLGVGVAGAHRTGKSSLCERLAEKNVWLPYVKTSVKEIAAEYGFNVDNHSSFEERMDWQEYLLEALAAKWEEQTTAFITDRTPLCMIGYMMADAPNGPISPEMDARIAAYVERCYELVERHFMMIFVVQPGIPFEPVPGAPAPNNAYQEKHNALTIGYGMNAPTALHVIRREVTDFEERATTMAQAIGTELGQYKATLRTLPMQ